MFVAGSGRVRSGRVKSQAAVRESRKKPAETKHRRSEADAAPQKTVIKKVRNLNGPRVSMEVSSADAENYRILPISDASGRVLLGQTQLKLKFPTSYAAADPAKSSPFPNPTLSSLWQVVRKR